QKLVESGNIKLGQVASDAPGVSGRAMLRALVRRRRRRREDQRPGAAAAEGKETGTAARPDRSAKAQRWVLSELLEQYEQAEAALARVEAKIRAELEAAWAA
ncbi:MAG TPA: hypothetical protein VNQ79_28420, partial [Blastocatellia bacterium]|nr:hypothetical protein [Blastocatellia bacterium]